MSAANNSAKKRRATNFESPKIGGGGGGGSGNYNPNAFSTQQPPQQPPQQGLTLPQVIAVIDKRLTNLEKNVNEINEKQEQQQQTPYSYQQPELEDLQPEPQPPQQFMNEYIEEYNSRFEILTEEIADLKNVVMKLQTYTMELNRALVEECLKNVKLEQNLKPEQQQPLLNIKEEEEEEEKDPPVIVIDVKNPETENQPTQPTFSMISSPPSLKKSK
jgi:hypothetical protein